MLKRISLFCVAAMMLTLGVCSNANAQNLTYIFGLSGDQEVPAGSGNPDGFGTATLMIDATNLTVDWDFDVSGIDTMNITAAHIHQAAAGSNGPVIVDFSAQLSGTGLTDTDLQDVIDNPTNHYVNIHTSTFPAGAIRGQLTAAVPEPGSVSLLALAGSVACMRRRKRN